MPPILKKQNKTVDSTQTQSDLDITTIDMDLETGIFDVSEVNNLHANEGDMGLIPVFGRSSGERNGNPLQYPCLGNPTEETGRLQYMGSQRVGHDLVTKQRHQL